MHSINFTKERVLFLFNNLNDMHGMVYWTREGNIVLYLVICIVWQLGSDCDSSLKCSAGISGSENNNVY